MQELAKYHLQAGMSKSEFISALRRLGLHDQAFLDRCFAIADESKDGRVDFASRVKRGGTLGDDSWLKLYGVTKTELYSIQRSIRVPALEPKEFVLLIRRLYKA